METEQSVKTLVAHAVRASPEDEAQNKHNTAAAYVQQLCLLDVRDNGSNGGTRLFHAKPVPVMPPGSDHVSAWIRGYETHPVEVRAEWSAARKGISITRRDLSKTWVVEGLELDHLNGGFRTTVPDDSIVPKPGDPSPVRSAMWVIVNTIITALAYHPSIAE